MFLLYCSNPDVSTKSNHYLLAESPNKRVCIRQKRDGCEVALTFTCKILPTNQRSINSDSLHILEIGCLRWNILEIPRSRHRRTRHFRRNNHYFPNRQKLRAKCQLTRRGSLSKIPTVLNLTLFLVLSAPISASPQLPRSSAWQRYPKCTYSCKIFSLLLSVYSLRLNESEKYFENNYCFMLSGQEY